MISPDVFRTRRERLLARVDGPILLLGNGERARNLPMNALPFRQDSSFLYFTGCDQPDAAALIDRDGTTVFLPEPPPDDVLWHGPSPSLEERRQALGVDRVLPASALEQTLSGKSPRTLAVSDPARNALGQRLGGRPLSFAGEHGDPDLVKAIIELRRPKSSEELDELRRAAAATEAAFKAVMSATRPGTHERSLATLFKAVLGLHGCVPGYSPILTVRGEVLHNHDHVHPITGGELLLLDGGGEVDTGYTVDVTRTWPTSGRFEPRQRTVYDVVLASQHAAIQACRPGVRYREVHDTACRVLARWLIDEGLLRCSVDEALETGAHGVFYPHGTGHHLGLDVHDLENFGDLSSYPPGQSRPRQFGTRNLRLDLPLEVDWVVTVEPGLYFVPAILADASLRESLGRRVDWDKAQEWVGFGGIRIEDDVWVTDKEPEVLTASIPKAPDAVEELVGSGAPPEERLC